MYIGKEPAQVALTASDITDGIIANAKLASGSFSNITSTGTLTSFTSTGVDDNASANSILIDSAGHVTKVLQPAVHAYASSAQNNIATGIVTINLNAEVYDVNSDFNTGTYTFTAPVTGKYMMNGAVILKEVDTVNQEVSMLMIASNRNYYFGQIDPRIELSADGLHGFTGTTLVDMDADDTILLKIRSSAHGATQINIHAGDTYFTIGLLC